MALRVSTVSSTVAIDDLGIKLTHPTVDYDLTEQFTAQELYNSTDLTNAIQNGDLTADDGTHSIAADDYEPAEVINQDLDLRRDDRFVSHDELGAGFKTTYTYPAVFPLGINSTASTTRNVYAPAARFITWSIEPGDIIVVTGNAAAGTYVVESVTDQQNLIVVSAITDSTGGNIEIFHPTASTRIGVDSSSLDWSSGDNLQKVLEDLDFVMDASGIEAHRSIDQLVHNIAEDSYEEITYSGIFATSVTVWTDSGKTTKIREEQYTYLGSKPQTGTIIQYDETGTEVERINETYNYTGGKITSIDRELI
jgi:hypothetical protein